jgi:AraC-like DNA-binding protein
MTRLFAPLAVDYPALFRVFPMVPYPVEDHVPFASHGHGRCAELAIIAGGTALHHSAAGTTAISRGDVLFVPVGHSHAYSECKQLSLVNLKFDPEEAALPPQWQSHIPGYHTAFALQGNPPAASGFVSCFRLGEAGLLRAIDLCRRIHNEVVEQRAGYRAAAKALFCMLMVELCRHEGTSESPVSDAMIRLSGLLGWLDRHYGERISTASMAERAHMSRSTLERHFRAAFNMSPRDFLIELRLRKAAELLQHSDEDIAQIAAMVGIEDPNYLGRLFKKHHGLSPRSFRKKVAEGG